MGHNLFDSLFLLLYKRPHSSHFAYMEQTPSDSIRAAVGGDEKATFCEQNSFHPQKCSIGPNWRVCLGFSCVIVSYQYQPIPSHDFLLTFSRPPSVSPAQVGGKRKWITQEITYLASDFFLLDIQKMNSEAVCSILTAGLLTILQWCIIKIVVPDQVKLFLGHLFVRQKENSLFIFYTWMNYLFLKKWGKSSHVPGCSQILVALNRAF